MKEVDEAIKELAKRSMEDSKQAHESMQLAQAVLNLTQAKTILEHIPQT